MPTLIDQVLDGDVVQRLAKFKALKEWQKKNFMVFVKVTTRILLLAARLRNFG